MHGTDVGRRAAARESFIPHFGHGRRRLGRHLRVHRADVGRRLGRDQLHPAFRAGLVRCLSGDLGVHRAHVRGGFGLIVAVEDRHLRVDVQHLVGLALEVFVDRLADRRELGIDPEFLEGGGAAIRGRGILDLEGAEVVGVIGGAVLEVSLARRVEEDVDGDPLRRGEQHLFDELLALDAATVATDKLHPRAIDGDVEYASIGRVDEVQADDLAGDDLLSELGLAVDQHRVAESTHRGEVRARPTERDHLPVLDHHVIKGDRQLAVGRSPVALIAGADDDRPVETHLLGVVLAQMRVVPVDAGIRELDPAGVGLADLDWVLGVAGHTIGLVGKAKAVPVDSGLDVAAVGGSRPRPQSPRRPPGRAPGSSRCRPAFAPRRRQAACGPG